MLAEHGAVDRLGRLPRAAFEMRSVIEVMQGRGLRDRLRSIPWNPRDDQLAGPLEVVRNIGPEMQHSGRFQDPVDVQQKRFVHHSPFVVSFLPPGIGKVDVHGGHARGRQRLGEETQSIAVQHRGVRLLLHCQTGRTVPSVFARYFDSQEVMLGPGHRRGGQKQPFAAADNAILMDYWGDEHMAAPTLNTVALELDEAESLFMEVMSNVELMLQNDLIHGDLSAYNILYW